MQVSTNVKSFASVAGFNTYSEFLYSKSSGGAFPTLPVRRVHIDDFSGETLMKYGLRSPIILEYGDETSEKSTQSPAKELSLSTSPDRDSIHSKESHKSNQDGLSKVDHTSPKEQSMANAKTDEIPAMNSPHKKSSPKPIEFLKIPNHDNVYDLFDYIKEILGSELSIRVIDVSKQSDEEMTLGEYNTIFKSHKSPNIEAILKLRAKSRIPYKCTWKIYNLISLEISFSKLASRVIAPKAIREIDHIDQIWSLQRRMMGDYPRVQKYCLISMAGSYTDFHVDFGGTSVWYHILKGSKIFYMIPPTIENLQLFEEWLGSKKQLSTFFADKVPKNCFEVRLNAGDTMVIPSGWIHSVHTLEDSLVFGGNFLTSHTILKQLQIYCIEYRTNVEDMYRFPYFRQLHCEILCSLYPAAKQLLRHKEMLIDNRNEFLQRDMSFNKHDMIFQGTSKSRLYWHLQCVVYHSQIIRQYMCLLKIVEVWISSGSMGKEDYDAFHQSCVSIKHTVSSIISFWWEFFETVVPLLYEGASEHVQGYMERVKNASVVNVFDEELNIFDETSYTKIDEETVPRSKSLRPKLTLTIPKPNETPSALSVEGIPKESSNQSTDTLSEPKISIKGRNIIFKVGKEEPEDSIKETNASTDHRPIEPEPSLIVPSIQNESITHDQMKLKIPTKSQKEPAIVSLSESKDNDIALKKFKTKSESHIQPMAKDKTSIKKSSSSDGKTAKRKRSKPKEKRDYADDDDLGMDANEMDDGDEDLFEPDMDEDEEYEYVDTNNEANIHDEAVNRPSRIKKKTFIDDEEDEDEDDASIADEDEDDILFGDKKRKRAKKDHSSHSQKSLISVIGSNVSIPKSSLPKAPKSKPKVTSNRDFLKKMLMKR